MRGLQTLSMKNKFIFFYFIFLLSPSLKAHDQLAIMGGGGEPSGRSTIFDYQINEFGRLSQDFSWKTQISFNGNHQKTESLLQSNFESKGIPNTPFTKDSFEKNISDYESKIMKGEIISGEKIMLIISSHGAIKQNGEKTHMIATNDSALIDYENLKGDNVSLDRLQKLIDLADDKGIKIALLDFSCHSGNSLNLRSKNACIISSTGPKHYSFLGPNSFDDKFLKLMKKGKNLEDVYLEARSDSQDSGFPMISTQAGTEVNKLLYETLTPFLYKYSIFGDKLSPYIKEEVALANACEGPRQFKELLNLIENTNEVIYSTNESSKLISALVDYYKVIENLRSKLAQLKTPDLKKEEEFCSNIGTKGFRECWTYTVEEILSFDPFILRAQFLEEYRLDPVKNKNWVIACLENIKKVSARKEEIQKQFPDFDKAKYFFRNQAGLESQTELLSQKVSLESKKLYQSLYRDFSRNNSAPNPCRDFKL